MQRADEAAARDSDEAAYRAAIATIGAAVRQRDTHLPDAVRRRVLQARRSFAERGYDITAPG